MKKILTETQAARLQLILDHQAKGIRGVNGKEFEALADVKGGTAKLAALVKQGLAFVNRAGKYQVSAQGKVALAEYRHHESCQDG